MSNTLRERRGGGDRAREEGIPAGVGGGGEEEVGRGDDTIGWGVGRTAGAQGGWPTARGGRRRHVEAGWGAGRMPVGRRRGRTTGAQGGWPTVRGGRRWRVEAGCGAGRMPVGRRTRRRARV